MAEYFNTYSKEYLSSLKKKSQRYLVKLELLSNSEKVIGEIVKDLESVGGQININYEQITRRSCSLAITDVRKKYLPSKNSTFWFNRKFKLWIGLIVHSNIYWWAQGVYYTTSATSEGRNLNIEAVDKGGALDGTLKIGMSSAQYTIKQGTGLVYALKQTLARQVGALDVVYRGNMKMGGDNPIDIIPPHIHTTYKNQIVQAEITLDRNAYFGDMITQFADLYAADAYYDVNGNFKFEPYIINSGYSYSPTLWSFTDLSSTFENANYSTTFDSENAVCVYTNASGTGIVNVAYTAYNTNPLSPCNIGIGIRRAQDIEIEYYDTSEEQMVKDCRSSANYYLKKNSMLGIQLGFSCPLIPHLDVNKTIEINDQWHDIANGIFVVQSITMPLGSNAMEISATNINWLPNDMEFDGTSELLGEE